MNKELVVGTIVTLFAICQMAPTINAADLPREETVDFDVSAGGMVLSLPDAGILQSISSAAGTALN